MGNTDRELQGRPSQVCLDCLRSSSLSRAVSVSWGGGGDKYHVGANKTTKGERKVRTRAGE